MNFGIITTQDCVNVTPGPNPLCSDPFYASQNPDECPAQPRLIIKPSVALTCQLGSVQFSAFKVLNGVETDVTGQAVFVSSDPSTAVIGVNSGNATGLAAGQVTIAATFDEMTAHAELDILAGTDCCEEQHVALMAVMDVTKSMSLSFNSSYATKLAYAKAAVTRFVDEIDGTKDTVGLITFTDSAQTLLSALTGNTASVGALIPGIGQTQDKTSFYNAISLAIGQLNASGADRKVLFLVSDGEDTGTTDSTTNDPFVLLDNFKAQGGIVMCLGVRASDNNSGFQTLSLYATGGFFVNAYNATADAAMDYISGLKGYVCAGNCTPAGDQVVNQGELNYDAFANWNVTDGNVDLLGNGFLDLMPGNGLYVDLGGTSSPHNGVLSSKTPFSLTAGHTYRVTLYLAGNQQNDPNDLVVSLSVDAGMQNLLSQTISITGNSQGFQPYSFSFTPVADMSATITIQQQLAPGYASVSDPRWGLLLDEVKFVDTTDIVTLLDDTFDTENPVYVPPGCGIGTTYVYLPSLGSYGYWDAGGCYGGYGCLSQPPGIQLPDPNPLSDVESGISPPPQQWTSTKTACASCPSGSVNVATTGLAFSYFDSNNDGTHLTSSVQLSGDAQTLIGYQIIAGASGTAALSAFSDFIFYGSNDGTTWDELDSQSSLIWSANESKLFALPGTTAYSYYRIVTSGSYGGGTQPVIPFTLFMANSLLAAAATQVCATATYTSSISQVDADTQAYNQALAAAQAQLNCQTFYTSTQQYTATCPVGSCGSPVTKSASAGSFISQHDADTRAQQIAQDAANAALDCSGCNNTQPITVADAPAPGQVGISSPWPSCACVSGKSGTITKVTVTLTGFNHTWPADIHAILRAPDGTAIYLFGNCGASNAITGVDLTFDDAAASSLTQLGTITSGTYKPTLYGSQVVFPAPAPQPTLATTLAAFNGLDPNGTWTLWFVDARQLDSGRFTGGWSIDITSA